MGCKAAVASHLGLASQGLQPDDHKHLCLDPHAPATCDGRPDRLFIAAGTDSPFGAAGGGRKVIRAEVSLDAGQSWLISNIIRFEEPTEYNKHWWVLCQCVMHMPAVLLHLEDRHQCSLWLPCKGLSLGASAQQQALPAWQLCVRMCAFQRAFMTHGCLKHWRVSGCVLHRRHQSFEKPAECNKHWSSRLLGMPAGSKTSSCLPAFCAAHMHAC